MPTDQISGATMITMTTAQVAQRYGVKEATVRSWYRRKVIKGYRLPHARLILIDVASMDEFLQSNSNKN